MSEATEFNIARELIAQIAIKNFGLESMALAGELIAADARFNYRILRLKDDPDCDLMELIEFYDEIGKRLESSLGQFELDQNYTRLNSILSEISGQLNSAALKSAL